MVPFSLSYPSLVSRSTLSHFPVPSKDFWKKLFFALTLKFLLFLHEQNFVLVLNIQFCFSGEKTIFMISAINFHNKLALCLDKEEVEKRLGQFE